MRIARVEIKNALCFRYLSVDVDPNFQVIAGPNNAGKSSLIRLLELFFSDPDRDQMLAVRPAHDYYTGSGARTLISVKLWFTELSGADRSACADALRQDKQVWVAVRCSRAGTISYLTSHELKGDRAREIFEYVLERHHFAKIPSIRIGGSGDLDRPASLERLIETLESILIRTGAARSTTLQQRFSDRSDSVEDIIKEVLDESADSIHSELPFQGGKVSFRMPEFRHALRGFLEATEIESGEGAVVPLDQRGTGFQSALVLGVLRYVAQKEASGSGNVVFAIEEPEAFLHPQTQRAMTQIIRSIANDAQVLVTTHSPVVTDSVRISQIARLPLEPTGTNFKWAPEPLAETMEGRLSRYCTAGNSELIFANAVIFVEGFGDQQLIEHLLDEACTDPGGYFARGVTVIPANGIGNIKHLVSLADRFGVRSFVLVDKDGLLKVNGARRLFDILAASKMPVPQETKQALIQIAEHPCSGPEDAVSKQREANDLLRAHSCFVLSSDLEGLVLDALGVDHVLDALGPNREAWINAQVVAGIRSSPDPRARLGKKLGSKGWNADQKPKEKLDPHLPRLLVSDAQGAGVAIGDEIDVISSWLNEVLDSAAQGTV